MEHVVLNNGVVMPLEGFGVFQIPDPAECEEVTWGALKAGYRLIDTAAAYGNEEAVGRAIRKSGIPREEIFVTSKLWVQDYGYEKGKAGLEQSLEKLGLDYLDLYLLHQPVGDVLGSWKALEEAYQDGKIRAIGVANFYPAPLADFCETVEILPAVDQVELHPFFAQPKALENMKAYGVQPQAWGPLAEGKHNIFTHPVLTAIGQKYGKTATQVALRWNVQRGVSIIPKSVHCDRIKQNLDIWDFQLTEEDMAQIGTLDLGHSEIVDHGDPAFIQMLHHWKIHS
ncbi:aldo/keto reductase [Acidaminococcus massiliensis]|jgi:2,5-diketo-D-gluconate reductase A|uniref:aldo/keto reductase n=1 Tax=Acidaminococcus massiliensis TaxID=1852375 RepID=UPI0023F32F12|nr:aldo/keto reductase [Acidaminococcus massiliensis]